MADFANLLDELNRPEQGEEEEQEQQGVDEVQRQLQHDEVLNSVTEEDGDTITTTNDNNEYDNNDGGILAFVPTALREAAAAASGGTGSATTTPSDPDYLPLRLDLQDLVPTRQQNDARMDEDEEDDATTQCMLQQEAYRALKSWWTHELYAPELLPWQGNLMDAWIGKLNQEEDNIDQDYMTATTTKHHQQQQQQQGHVRALMQSIRRMDRQHLQFILSNLLSTRLRKIHRYHTWLVTTVETKQNDDDNNDNDNQNEGVRGLLGPAEHEFLMEYHTLWTKHMQTMVTDQFPQQVWKALDEPDMVQAPDLDEFCWVRFRHDTTLHLSQSQQFTQDNHQPEQNNDQEDDDELNQRYSKGTILVIPYRHVRELIREGKAELFL